MKKIVMYCLGVMFLFSGLVSVMAQESFEMSGTLNSESAVSSFQFPSNLSRNNSLTSSYIQGVENIIIDDSYLLAQLIELNNIYVPEGYELTEIQFINSEPIKETLDYNFECENGNIDSRVLCLNYISNARRRAGSFYYPLTFMESTFRNETQSANSSTRTFSKTTSSGWSATGSITQNAVTNAVGFNASTSKTVTESATINLEARRTTVVHTWASAAWTDFDTRNTCTTIATGQRTGTGSAHRPIGIRHHVFTRAL